jgi:hypothetical protein
MKYQALTNFLLDLKPDVATMSISFEDLERLLGMELPPSAKKYQAWWTNSKKSQPQAGARIDAGWAVQKVDFEQKKVIFEHVVNRKSTDPMQAEDKDKASNTSFTSLDSRSFEVLCRAVLEKTFGKRFEETEVPGVPKRFDFVSEDGDIVGDAKFFTLVHGEKLPPAKFSIIAEHVWLLEHTDAKRRVLIFGNDVRVPKKWLAKYGHLVKTVEFLFLNESGKLEKLNKIRGENDGTEEV